MKKREPKYKWNESKPKFTEGELREMEGRPNLLFAAIKSPMYDGQFMADGFEEAGYNVSVMNWSGIRFAEGEVGVNDRLLTKTKMENPKVAFLHIQSPGILFPDTLAEMSKRIFVVLYTFDVREEIAWMKELAPHVGLILFSDKESIRQCNADGIMNVGYLPPAADYRLYRKLEVREVTAEYGDVVFIGNNYTSSPQLKFEKAEERVEMVNFMKKEFGKRFRCYGLNWGNDTQIIYPHNEVLIYNSAQVAITHNHFFREGYQSDRAFRSMGCSCHTIAQYFPGINTQFTPTTASTWLNFDMLATQVEKALSDFNWRKLVGDNGAKHVRENHSWKNRAEEMNRLIELEKQRGINYGVGMAD